MYKQLQLNAVFAADKRQAEALHGDLQEFLGDRLVEVGSIKLHPQGSSIEPVDQSQSHWEIAIEHRVNKPSQLPVKEDEVKAFVTALSAAFKQDAEGNHLLKPHAHLIQDMAFRVEYESPWFAPVPYTVS